MEDERSGQTNSKDHNCPFVDEAMVQERAAGLQASGHHGITLIVSDAHAGLESPD